MKAEDNDRAQICSSAYCLKQKHGNHHKLRIVFPITKTRIGLQIFVPVDQHLLVIKVFDSSDYIITEEVFKKFLCMLYAGVHYILFT